MKLSLLFAFAAIILTTASYAQNKRVVKQVKDAPAPSLSTKKYTSLLWEITGNGLKKPSYLFGTMHVSNKLVFNLSDSFYNAIKSVEVVALEQNPEVWQKELADNKNLGNENYSSYYGSSNAFNFANDRITQRTFSIGNYESKLKLALSSEARMVNGMLYRNNVGMEDFEEETYLDMFIYRIGRKLNKTITGVEDYKESNRIVKEAYIALNKDKNRKERYDAYNSRSTIEDAYRRGDLDVLDSIETANVVSDAFQEKFLYLRNKIQANSIDTIIRKHSLFVGVGAAHLAGNRGVIELLREKGYKLRPVVTGTRDSDEKDQIEKIRVPLQFCKQYAEDSAFTVDIPGSKLYRYGSSGSLNMIQYADMSNGSYYMVTRVKTNASLLGHSTATVIKKTDSLLYENIPGKILSKKTIVKNGYNGFDIITKTRKGNVQRYNIFVLPDEVIFFKVSGIGDYLTEGKEVEQYFSSINFKNESANPALYSPKYGGFTARFPSQPFYISNERNDRSRDEWISQDNNGNAYFVFKANIEQYDYIEKDTFELRLAEESFISSKMLKDPVPGRFSKIKNYPVINAKYQHTDGSLLKVRYFLQGNNFYVIGVKCKRDDALADNFINSFEITPYVYEAARLRTDTIVGYTVASPVFYKTETDSTDNISAADMYGSSNEEASLSYKEMTDHFFIKSIGNDTSGEHVSVWSVHFPQYVYIKDSVSLFLGGRFFISDTSKFTTRKKETYTTADKWTCHYYEYGGNESSRTIMVKTLYRNGILFYLVSQGDTITQMSSFVKNVFDSFTPIDTIKSFNPFEKKSGALFADYFSKDSVRVATAVRALNKSLFNPTDLPNIIKAIEGLSWNNKKYIAVKKKWIAVMEDFKDTASINYLAKLYKAVTDTSDLQNAVLDALLNMKTLYAFNTFKNLVIVEPPALTSSSSSEYSNYNLQSIIESSLVVAPKRTKRQAYYNSKWKPLFDTIQLSAPLIPELMDLFVLDDYKSTVTSLLEAALDSGLIKGEQYRQYYNKFLLEGKQAVKKQAAYENEKEINKLNNKNEGLYDSDDYGYGYNRRSDGLGSYATLLMPFWNYSSEVPALFEKLLKINDKKTALEVSLVMAHNNKPIPDSVLTKIASDDKYRYLLYKSLRDFGKENLFPKKYLTQQQIAKSMLRSNYNSTGADSLVYLDKLAVNENKYKGWIYFYGYKRGKSDNTYKIAMCGLQPTDTSKISVNDDDDEDNNSGYFTRFTTRSYTSKKEMETKLKKLLKEALYDLRPSSSRFYNKYSNDDDDDGDRYFSETIRSQYEGGD